MSVSLLYGCFQIELVVSEIASARAFMERALGAAPIEQEFAADLRTLLPDGYGIDHVDCGGGTFQLNETPAQAGSGQMGLGVHADYLARVGPCVTNLNFYVDDFAHARDVFAGRGAALLMQGPSTIASSLADYGPDNTRPGADQRPFLFMGTRPLLGFDFEFMEPNFERFVDQTVQQPCFVGHRPGDGVAGLRLQRLTVVVEDVTQVYADLVELFTPASRSQVYAFRRGSDAMAFRISLGGIELEYRHPLGATGPLAEHLARCGPGVVTAEMTVPSIRSLRERVDGTRWALTDAVDLVGEDHPVPRWQIAGRDEVGFDVVVEEH